MTEPSEFLCIFMALNLKSPKIWWEMYCCKVFMKNENFAERIRVGVTLYCLFFFLLFPEKCYHFIFQRYRLEHYTVSSNWLALGTVFLFGLLSLSRSVALFRGWYFRFALCSPGLWARGLQKLCCFARRNQEPREVWRSLLQGKE